MLSRLNYLNAKFQKRLRDTNAQFQQHQRGMNIDNWILKPGTQLNVVELIKEDHSTLKVQPVVKTWSVATSKHSDEEIVEKLLTEVLKDVEGLVGTIFLYISNLYLDYTPQKGIRTFGVLVDYAIYSYDGQRAMIFDPQQPLGYTSIEHQLLQTALIELKVWPQNIERSLGAKDPVPYFADLRTQLAAQCGAANAALAQLEADTIEAYGVLQILKASPDFETFMVHLAEEDFDAAKALAERITQQEVSFVIEIGRPDVLMLGKHRFTFDRLKLSTH
jgi:hypothetical protein